MVDAFGRLVKFSLKPGNAAESPELATLLDDVATAELIADKAYDTDIARRELAGKGIIPVIPARVNRRGNYLLGTVAFCWGKV